MTQEKKWTNRCLFHGGEAELSVEGKRVKFIVCRTCGATGPYGNDTGEAIRRWYDGVSTDELRQDNLDTRPGQGDSVQGDTEGANGTGGCRR